MSSQDHKHRSHLPMPNTGRKGLITFDAKDPASRFPPIERLRPPNGAPNVLIVLIDDVGFGATSAFGGPCQTPTAERLAAGGLKFTRFHTTALCSPTRQALLTGRNHHSVGMGGITEIATGAPGYCSVLPNSMAPLSKTQAQWLQHGPVRQMPRGSGVGDEPRGGPRATGPADIGLDLLGLSWLCSRGQASRTLLQARGPWRARIHRHVTRNGERPSDRPWPRAAPGHNTPRARSGSTPVAPTSASTGRGDSRRRADS